MRRLHASSPSPAIVGATNETFCVTVKTDADVPLE
jgi:hypothetical protein